MEVNSTKSEHFPITMLPQDEDLGILAKMYTMYKIGKCWIGVKGVIGLDLSFD